MLEAVRADVRRMTAQEPGLASKLGLFFFHPGLQAVLFYRLARWLLRHHLGPFAVVTSYVNSVLTGAQISPRAIIGKGLRIYHPQGVVIGAGAVVGEHCTLSHGNMIGTFAGDEERPVIGDYFTAAAASGDGRPTAADTVERLVSLLWRTVEAVPLPAAMAASTGLLGEGIGL